MWPLVERWWKILLGDLGRRDIWLSREHRTWHVHARRGGAAGEDVQYRYDQEWQARAMVDRLIKAAPVGRWQNITRLVTKPSR